MIYLMWFIQILLIPALSPLVIGIIRKFKAKFARKKGASVFQPYRDLWKLFHKDEHISTDASWIFLAAPFVIFAVTLVVSFSIPNISLVVNNMFTGDILVIIYLLALATFFLAMAGMDTGSAFGGFGSSREVTLAALAEAGFLFSFIVFVFLTGTTNTFGIAAGMVTASNAVILPALLALIGFFIVMLAEAARYPFDNPSTHLELTMVHEAMILEYSGKRLALMEWAAANKLMIFMTIITSVFFPWGVATTFTFGTVVYALLVYLVKLIILAFAVAAIESTIAKFRFFRLPDLLFVSFIVNVIAISLILR